MALTPGGGRSPSTRPPTSPPTNGQHRPTRDRRVAPPSRAASFSVVRWGALIGGLVIIAATIFDRKIRAFDRRNGQLLWQAQLPYSGQATPITYMIDGRQYVLIAASGGRDPKEPRGSAYVAFALPAGTRQ